MFFLGADVLFEEFFFIYFKVLPYIRSLDLFNFMNFTG